MNKVELYAWQKDAVSRLRNQNGLLCVPTGEGKTAVAKAWADLDNSSSVIFTAPIKAISNERYFELLDEGYDVGLVTGDCVINPKAPILCMTQEIYTDRYAEYENQKVIFDEIGYIGRDLERQQTYFEGLSRTPDSSKILCMSATIGNVDELREWLEQAKNNDTFIVYENNTRRKKIEVEKSFDLETDYIAPNSLVFAFSQKKCVEIAHKIAQDREQAQATGEPELQYLLNKDGTNFNQARLDKLADLLKICGLLDKFNEDQTWKEQIALGVGVYYGKMDFNEKLFIETAMKTGLIDVIVGTDALALGVNLPCRNTYIMSSIKAGEDLTYNEIIQMAGRAGRDKKYERGRVFFSKDFDVWHMLKNATDITDIAAGNIELKDYIPVRDPKKGLYDCLNLLSIGKGYGGDPVRYILGNDEYADYRDYNYVMEYHRIYGEYPFTPLEFDDISDDHPLKAQLLAIDWKYEDISDTRTGWQIKIFQRKEEIAACDHCIYQLQSFVNTLSNDFYVFPEINAKTDSPSTERATMRFNAVRDFVESSRTDYMQLSEILHMDTTNNKYRLKDFISDHRQAFYRGPGAPLNGFTMDEINGNHPQCLNALHWCSEHIPEIQGLISDIKQRKETVRQELGYLSKISPRTMAKNAEYTDALYPYIDKTLLRSLNREDCFETAVNCLKCCFDIPLREQQDKYEGAEQLLQNVHQFIVSQRAPVLDGMEKKTFSEIIAILKKDGTAIQYVPECKQTLPMALVALRQDHESYKYLAPQFRTPDVFAAAGYLDYKPEALAALQTGTLRTLNTNRG